jgi:hypothetical protein
MILINSCIKLKEGLSISIVRLVVSIEICFLQSSCPGLNGLRVTGATAMHSVPLILTLHYFFDIRRSIHQQLILKSL